MVENQLVEVLHADDLDFKSSLYLYEGRAAQAVRQLKYARSTSLVPYLASEIARGVTLAKKRHRLALALSIEDNGPGIAAAIRDKMFYPLVSGREGGSGLGLTIAQTFIAQHDGTIEWASTPGQTSFTILLPLEMMRA